MIRCRPLALLLALPLLHACVYLPRTTTVYDEKCALHTKRMSLRLEQAAFGNFGSCSSKECAYILLALGAVAAGSAVVSGSIVVVGNYVHWLEKQGRCQINPQASRLPVIG